MMNLILPDLNKKIPYGIFLEPLVLFRHKIKGGAGRDRLVSDKQHDAPFHVL